MAGTVCWATNFHNRLQNLRLRKDNSVTKVFMAELQKDKLNPDFIQLESSQPAFTCSKLTIDTVEQGVKYVQS